MGISQSKLGLTVGIIPSHISDIESWRRYPCPKWRASISQFFDMPEHELFPKPSDLIDMVRQLLDENEALRQQLETTNKRAIASRDNTRFL